VQIGGQRHGGEFRDSVRKFQVLYSNKKPEPIFHCSLVSGRAHRSVRATANLTSWVDLYTNANGGLLHFTDTAATNLNQRFYRTVKP
jgi:hypothetical protein